MNGEGAQTMRAHVRLEELPGVPTDLEPRSSIGEGGKLSHLVRTSFVVGTSRSMPTAGEEVESGLGVFEQSD